MFWCDGVCRNDYKDFIIVVAFDTTYKVNAYKKPFVVIVGVNHHRRVVPFAIALIVNEKEQTYTWVLQQLLEVGGNNAPYTVITNGDRGMENIIKVSFPDARHKLCLSQLMRDIKGHTKCFCSGFMKCVDGYRTINDYEQAWGELMTFYEVTEHQWTKYLYRDKQNRSGLLCMGIFLPVSN